jgi:hypothetical protein
MMMTAKHLSVLLLVLFTGANAYCDPADQAAVNQKISKAAERLVKECGELKEKQGFLKMQTNSIYMQEAFFIAKLNVTQKELYAKFRKEIGRGDLAEMTSLAQELSSSLSKAQQQEFDTLLARNQEARESRREYNGSRTGLEKQKQTFLELLASLKMDPLVIFGFERLLDDCPPD